MWNRNTRRWNIFARELEDILATRGLQLTHIDDRTPIHREKVRRLVHSLHTPKSFPVLNPDEIEMVTSAFRLNIYEVLRLRAAILTTAIEAMLMDRINKDDALAVAEQVLPMILNAMRMGGMSTVRGETYQMNNNEESEMDMALESTLEMIDRANISLHLSQNVGTNTERIRFVRQALEDFKQALVSLEETEGLVQTIEIWHIWHKEAQQGIEVANQYLEDFGV